MLLPVIEPRSSSQRPVYRTLGSSVCVGVLCRSSGECVYGRNKGVQRSLPQSPCTLFRMRTRAGCRQVALCKLSNPRALSFGRVPLTHLRLFALGTQQGPSRSRTDRFVEVTVVFASWHWPPYNSWNFTERIVTLFWTMTPTKQAVGIAQLCLAVVCLGNSSPLKVYAVVP
jgi:hypothetical protein